LLPIGFIIYFVWTKNNIRKDYKSTVAKLDHIIELLESQQKELN
jgi:exonuclease VII small subunit